jgi:hypothetical protein
MRIVLYEMFYQCAKFHYFWTVGSGFLKILEVRALEK